MIDYTQIPMAWFLGDEGELGDFNRQAPWLSGDFDPQFGRLFLEYIQIGLTDRQACLEVPMNEKWPRTWLRGRRNTPEDFVEAYLRYAKPLQFDIMANDIVDIADGTDALANEEAIVNAVENPLRDVLKKTRDKGVTAYRKMVGERISARKWYVSKMQPKKYGDKVQIDHGNANSLPFKKLNYGDMSDDQISKLIAIDEELNKDGKSN